LRQAIKERDDLQLLLKQIRERIQGLKEAE